MATNINIAETTSGSFNTRAMHHFTFTSRNYDTVNGVTTTPIISLPTGTVYYDNNADSRSIICDYINLKGYLGTQQVIYQALHTRKSDGRGMTAHANQVVSMNLETSTYPNPVSVSLSTIFNSNNSAQRVMPIRWVISYGFVQTHQRDAYNQHIIVATGEVENLSFNEGTLTLNAPPIIDNTHNTVTASFSPAGTIYTEATTISVTASNLSAQYGGTITKVEFILGNQVVEASPNLTSTMTIIPQTSGTFIPTVRFTDSRGQISERTLDEITVVSYDCTVLDPGAMRTNSSYKKDDEGTYAVIWATFKHPHFTGSTLTKPIVSMSAPMAGTSVISDAITWYKNWNSSTGTFSNAVTSTSNWSALPEEIILYGKITNMTFDKTLSYNVIITPTTTIKTQGGLSLTTTLSQSFYLLAGKAGGHGLGIGMKPTSDALHVNMDSYFYEPLLATNMTSSEISGFINNLEIGNHNNTAVDLVIAEGVSGIWHYRKWSSGISECWGTYVGNITHYYNPLSGLYAFNSGNIDFPTGLFNAAPTAVADGKIASAFYIGTLITTSATTVSVVAMANASGTLNCTFHIMAKGTWK